MTERRRLSITDKLSIMVRQSICPLCGEKLGSLDGIDFDHVQALALGGADTVDNLRAVHRACHRVKTSGTKATTAGSDVQVIAKGKRLARDTEEFRRRILAKDAGEPEKSKSRMRSGPMPGTRASGLKRGFNGCVTRREV